MNETDVFNALKYRTYDAKLGRYVWRNSTGQVHRIGGPAIEWDDGSKEWVQNDQLHRTDGPAVEYDGNETWYINGEYLPDDEVDTYLFNQWNHLDNQL